MRFPTNIHVNVYGTPPQTIPHLAVSRALQVGTDDSHAPLQPHRPQPPRPLPLQVTAGRVLGTRDRTAFLGTIKSILVDGTPHRGRAAGRRRRRPGAPSAARARPPRPRPLRVTAGRALGTSVRTAFLGTRESMLIGGAPHRGRAACRRRRRPGAPSAARGRRPRRRLLQVTADKVLDTTDSIMALSEAC